MIDYDYVHLVKDHTVYLERLKQAKENNTTHNLYDYLEKHYPYLFVEVGYDDFASRDDTFMLFVETIFDEKVVGFFTLDFNYEKNDIYVI